MFLFKHSTPLNLLCRLLEPCNSEGVGYMFNSSKKLRTCKGRTHAHMCGPFSGLWCGLFWLSVQRYWEVQSSCIHFCGVENTWFGSIQYSLLHIITERVSKHLQLLETLLVSRLLIGWGFHRSGVVFERTFNNRFMSVFRFDDEEEAHFLTRWEITPYPCVPTFHVTQDCLLEKKKEGGIQESKNGLFFGTFRDRSCVRA